MFEKHINLALVKPNMAASTKEEALHEMSLLICHEHKKLGVEEVESALSEREHLDSTGIQDGIAIPHAKLESVTKPILAVGRSAKGINFNSHDNKPTQLFFVMLAPSAATGEHIKLLARLAQVLATAGIKDKLMEASSAKEMLDTLAKFEEKLTG